MQIQNKTGSNIPSEDDILDIIQTILNLKQQLNQINSQDNSEEQQKLQKQTDQILIHQRNRFKTHNNLGAIRQRKFSQYKQDFKVVYDEIKENQSNDNEDIQELIQISPKKPWQFQSSSKNSEKKMEYLSEQQIKSQNQKSIASISSNASFQDLGIITLKEELQTVYSYYQTEEDNKEESNCCFDILDEFIYFIFYIVFASIIKREIKLIQKFN